MVARARTESGRKVALLAVATLTVVSTMAIAPSLPAMAAAFASHPNAELLVKLALTLPAIAIAVCAPLVGWIIDRFGRLRMLFASMALFGAAGVSGYFVDDLQGILISRFVLGMAIAGTMTTVHALSGDYFSGEARLRFAGLQSVVMSFGAMVLVGLAGLIADANWRYPFLLYVYGWLLIPLVAWLVDEPPRSVRRGGAEPDQPLRAWELGLAYALGWFAAAMFYMVASQLPFLVRERGIQSGVLLGLAVGLVQLFAAVGSHFFVAIKRTRSFQSVYAIAFIMMSAGYGLIALTTSYVLVLLGAMITGIGVGLFFPNGTLWVLMLAPPRLRGRCSGGMSASLNFGQFTSPIVLQPIVVATGVTGAFGVSAGMLALVAGMLIASAPRSAQST